MTPSTKVGIAGIILGLILLIIGGPLLYIGIAVVVLAIAVPIGGSLALDKSQRRRVRAIRDRNRGRHLHTGACTAVAPASIYSIASSAVEMPPQPTIGILTALAH